MAKDDYHVIVYQILSYLYQCLKQGKQVEKEYLIYNGILFKINYNYWLYIIENMLDSGLIRGIENVSVGNGYYIAEQFKHTEITPKGIEYLFDNSFMAKAKHFLKDLKEITPFI